MLKDGEIKQGQVKWYDEKKGYGFIMPDGETKEIFVHATRIKKEFKMNTGLRVAFVCKQGNQGMMASNVTEEANNEQ